MPWTKQQTKVAGVDTIRDLLRCCVELQAGTGPAVSPNEAPAIAEDIDRWLATTGAFLTAAGLFLYSVNRVVVRGLFRLRVTGLHHLRLKDCSSSRPTTSAISTPWRLPSQLRRMYWTGDIVRLFHNAASRLLCRAIHLFPVDEKHPGAAVRAAVRVLQAGHVRVWFPEVWRSPDGRLQRFLPGIGQLLLRSHAVAVPAWITGAFEALPRGAQIPRLRQITLDFGPPCGSGHVAERGSRAHRRGVFARALRDRVVALATTSGHNCRRGRVLRTCFRGINCVNTHGLSTCRAPPPRTRCWITRHMPAILPRSAVRYQKSG
jgi:long-chain acyl-CoA synthetase